MRSVIEAKVATRDEMKELVEVAFVSTAFVAVRLVKNASTALKILATRLLKKPFVDVALSTISDVMRALSALRFKTVPEDAVKSEIVPLETERFPMKEFVVVEFPAIRLSIVPFTINVFVAFNVPTEVVPTLKVPPTERFPLAVILPAASARKLVLSSQVEPFQ
jgi:hypothetical protein